MANTFDIWVVLGFKDKASPEMKKAAKATKEMKDNFLKMGVAAAAAAVALKKIYDAGKQGAAIAQTTESFERLGVSIEEMRKASLGTIDDMTLMSSTLTLTAGASNALQNHLLDNAPQLLQIAKAANKLNPALGDTASQYESLALGIKRASPMILDNLGLTIKVGQANEDYADSIGKLVGDLTAEEKQIALLNATIRAGDRLIEQAGGNVESMGDSYAQLETNIKNVTDELKVQVADAIGPFIDGLADGILKTKEYNDVLGDHAAQLALIEKQTTGTTAAYDQAAKSLLNATAMAKGSKFMQELYREELARTNTGLANYTAMVQGANFELDRNKIAAENAASAFDMMTQETQEADEALSKVQFAQAAEKAATLQIAVDNATASLEGMAIATFIATQMEALASQTGEAALTAQELADANRALLIGFGLLTESEEKAQQQINELNAAFGRGAIDLATYEARLRAIKNGVDNIPNYKKILIEIEERRTIATTHASTGFDTEIGATGRAGGFDGVISQPTLLRVGEDRPERVIVQPTTNHNYDVTINTQASSGTFAQDIMQAQAMAQ
jgi:hypothetical protein